MLRTFAAFLCICFAVPASGKLGETVPQLAKRFGKNYTVEQVELGKKYKFRSAKIIVDAVVANGVSISETYLSDHPLAASGEPPNDIVGAVLRTNVPNARWVEIEAAPFTADYALRSSDNEYIAILKYTGVQPENSVWIMTVGLAKAVRALSSATSPSANPSPPTSTAEPSSPFVLAAPTPHTGLSVSTTPPEFEDIKAKAETGDADSEYQLGLRYYKGDGVVKDFSEAAKWYRKGAEQGLAVAQGALARCYVFGEGVPKDFAEAVNWSRKAAEQGEAVGQNILGLAYLHGDSVPKDAAEAVKWFRKAADQGFAKAQINLGLAYARGEDVPKDFVEAVKWFRKAAEQGVAGAQVKLGVAYARGEGVPKDFVEAVKWVRKAAEQGDSYAQFDLAHAYYLGEGVSKNLVEAVKWFRKAAEQGLAPAQRALAICYERGDGVNKDSGESAKWSLKAAQQGDGIAQAALGHAYANGFGVRKNLGEAVKWYRKAAEQGVAVAQANLGLAYARGIAIPKDFVEAVKWFRKAAEQGNVEAEASLGICYATGQGVPKDEVEGYKWSLLAAAKGDQSAKKNIAIAESRMTRYEIAQGQKLARDFTPHEVASSGADSSSVGTMEARPTSAGTGFFITEDGYLITNEHVAGNGADLRLLTADGMLPAKLVQADAGNDLALLKAQGKFAALPVVTSRSAKLGDSVATIGFPNIVLQGFAPKFARGEIASLSGARDDARYFQISLPVQPGNSGGALVDEQGNVIGVVSAKLSARAALLSSGALPENVNYAVKSSFLLGFLESVPELSGKLKEPNTNALKFAEVVEHARKATVLVLVYSSDLDESGNR